MRTWTSGPVDGGSDGGSRDLDEVKPGWTGQERSRDGESRHLLMSTDYVLSYELGPGRPSEINHAWPRDSTIATPTIAFFLEPQPMVLCGEYIQQALCPA